MKPENEDDTTLTDEVIQRGLDDIESGRVRPASEVFAELDAESDEWPDHEA